VTLLSANQIRDSPQVGVFKRTVTNQNCRYFEVDGVMSNFVYNYYKPYSPNLSGMTSYFISNNVLEVLEYIIR